MDADIGYKYLTGFSTNDHFRLDTLEFFKFSPYNQLIGIKLMILWKDLGRKDHLFLRVEINNLDFEMNHRDDDDCDNGCQEIFYHRSRLIPFNKPLDNVRALLTVIHHFILIYNDGLPFSDLPLRPISMEPLVQILYRSYLLVIAGTSAFTRTRSKEQNRSTRFCF